MGGAGNGRNAGLGSRQTPLYQLAPAPPVALRQDQSDSRTTPVVIGIDVGSTTVKATVVDPKTLEILWCDYQRHQTRQPEKVLEFLVRIGQAFPNVPPKEIRTFITGSGAGPITAPIGSKFVQEVNAVTMAVEKMYPDAGSVVELGGQDAKIIIFKVNEDTGQKQAITSMNDKCASGTGATIDKCLIKIGIPPAETRKLRFDDSRLHHVAAKCGVFAETDIVNLVKSGIPSAEIICSLGDAIVMQNLSVLTRGNTLRPRVILLGGPNTYLPFLQDCWRKRIPETWRERGFDYPQDVPLDELIVVPEHAEYYAAYGAVLYGLHEPLHVGRYAGTEKLEEFIRYGRKSKLSASAGPPLVENSETLERFRAQYTIPEFEPARFTKGEVVRGIVGLDGGSTSSKCVLVDETGNVLKKEYQLSKGNPILDTKEMLARLKAYVDEQGAELEVIGLGATGYAADVLEKSLQADVNIVETVAHMQGARHYFADVDVICDIGGQDIKVLFMKNGELRDFKLSNQCSAGNGMLLQAMADQFGVPVTEYADLAFQATLSPEFSYGCAVFLDSDRVNFQKEGFSKEELMAGLAMVLPKNIWQYVVQVSRLAELGRRFVLQGGTQYNLAAVKAQVDYIQERVPDAEILVHPHAGEAGAIGAAMEAARVVKQRGHSTFVGLDQAIHIDYTTQNDETTRCRFCANECARTFIDTKTPDGRGARYIAGFSCEQGTVEDKEALKALHVKRRAIMKSCPNLVTYEAKRSFSRWFEPQEMPEAGTWIEDYEIKKTRWGSTKRVKVRRGFRRSSPAAVDRRREIRVGIPRVLNTWATGPFWRTYFEALGLQGCNVVFSDETSEEMWQEGGKYGSVDPCYPAKVAQAHIHNLLFHKHTPQKPLNYVFFPGITHVPSFLEHLQDTAACTMVAGTPKVMRAAFTKESDFFAQRGIEFVDNAVTFAERNYMMYQLYEAWEERLQITEDENDFAVEQAWRALEAHDADLQEKGRAILEQVEREGRMCLLFLGRPYHNDPGLNHRTTEEFQALGYPVISVRSIPKDREWLERFFPKEVAEGRDVLDIRDVWPENYSAFSAAKVWGAKFAAHHPNVAVLDVSSFKCGHDAPTYGIIEGIISTSNTAYSALHDIDANNPSGSIKIRVKTYAYSLKRRQERLVELGRKRKALARRVLQKRVQLLRGRAFVRRRDRHDAAGALDALPESCVMTGQSGGNGSARNGSEDGDLGARIYGAASESPGEIGRE